MRRSPMLMLVAGVMLIPALASAQNICSAVSSRQNNRGVASVAAAALLPTVTVCVNGKLYDLSASIVTRGKLAVLPTTTVNLGNGASFTVSSGFNSDPFSNFTFGSVLPTGFGAFTFDAYFSTPVAPGSYTSAMSSGTLGITAASATGATATGTVTMGNTPFYITGYGDLMDLGVSTGSGPCSVSTPPNPNSVSCNPPGASNTFAPISPLFLTARLSYTQNTTGSGSSTVGWTGAVTLNAATTTTPEPATFALLAGGLLLIGSVLLNRKRMS